MGSHFIEDPVGGDVPHRFIPITWGPMTFRLNSQGVHTYVYICIECVDIHLHTPRRIPMMVGLSQ